jgi:hypothetical protein
MCISHTNEHNSPSYKSVQKLYISISTDLWMPGNYGTYTGLDIGIFVSGNFVMCLIRNTNCSASSILVSSEIPVTAATQTPQFSLFICGIVVRVPSPIPSTTRHSENYCVWNGVPSAS